MQYLSFLASVFKSILDLGKICCSLITIKYLEEIKSMLAPDLECKTHTHTLRYGQIVLTQEIQLQELSSTETHYKICRNRKKNLFNRCSQFVILKKSRVFFIPFR